MAYEDDFVIHGLNDFGQVPWDQMHPESCGKDWSFGRGGHGYPADALHITTYDKKTKKFHIWPMPKPIDVMMKANADVEVRNRITKIRQLLEID